MWIIFPVILSWQQQDTELHVSGIRDSQPRTPINLTIKAQEHRYKAFESSSSILHINTSTMNFWKSSLLQWYLIHLQLNSNLTALELPPLLIQTAKYVHVDQTRSSTPGFPNMSDFLVPFSIICSITSDMGSEEKGLQKLFPGPITTSAYFGSYNTSAFDLRVTF